MLLLADSEDEVAAASAADQHLVGVLSAPSDSGCGAASAGWCRRCRRFFTSLESRHERLRSQATEGFSTLGAKSNKRCDRLNIFKTITVQKNPIVLTGCKRFSDITFLSNQISTFGMVIVCTGTDHRRRSVEIFVELASSVERHALKYENTSAGRKLMYAGLRFRV